MTGKCFVDSNILVYLYDHASPDKRQQALATIGNLIKAEEPMCLSAQVLAEFSNVATRKLKLSSEDVRQEVLRFAPFLVGMTDVDLILHGLTCMSTANLSFWDSMIVAAARQAGCAILLTEDLNDGQVIDGVRIVNPFNPANAGLLNS